MSAANPDAIACRWCADEFEGPNRRADYREHLRTEHEQLPPIPAAPVSEQEPEPSRDDSRMGKARAAPEATAPATDSFGCTCGRTFPTSFRLATHGGAMRRNGHKGHGPVPGKPEKPKKATAPNKPEAPRAGSETAAAPAPIPASAPESTAAVASDTVTLQGGTVTFLVSIDLAALPESLEAVLAGLRTEIARFMA